MYFIRFTGNGNGGYKKLKAVTMEQAIKETEKEMRNDSNMHNVEIMHKGYIEKDNCLYDMEPVIIKKMI